MSILTIAALSTAAYVVGTIISTFIMLGDKQIKSFDEWDSLDKSKKFDICGPALIWFLILPLLIMVAIAWVIYTCAWVIYTCSLKLFNGLIKGYFYVFGWKERKRKKEREEIEKRDREARQKQREIERYGIDRNGNYFCLEDDLFYNRLGFEAVPAVPANSFIKKSRKYLKSKFNEDN